MSLVWLVSHKPSADTKENLEEEQQDHIQRAVRKANTPGNYFKTSDWEALQRIRKMALFIYWYKKGKYSLLLNPKNLNVKVS